MASDRQDPETTLCEMRDLLRDIRDEMVDEEQDSDHNETSGYVCEECGETFDHPGKLGAHVSNEHREISYPTNTPDKAKQILKLIHQLPSNRVTCSMLKPFYDGGRPSPYLSTLYQEGFVERYGEGVAHNPYGYVLTEKGEEVVEGSDDGR